MHAAVSSVQDNISDPADNSPVKSKTRWTKAKHQETFSAQNDAKMHAFSFLQLFDAELHARVAASSSQHHHLDDASDHSQHFAEAAFPRDILRTRERDYASW